MRAHHQLQSDTDDTLVARARALAHGLRTFQPQQDLPRALWETAYLLQESANSDRPLTERLRILGLMTTSIDRFFAEQLPIWRANAAQDAAVARQLQHLPAQLQSILQQASMLLSRQLLPHLTEEEGIRICVPAALNEESLQWVRNFFHRRVYPLLTPLAVDPGHPFPFISSFSLNLLVELRPDPLYDAWESPNYARIKVPRLLPRYIHVPSADKICSTNGRMTRCYLQSEELLRFFLPNLFPGLTVQGAYLFRVVRAAEPNSVRQNPLQRRTRQQELSLPVVRLDVEEAMPPDLLTWLTDHLAVTSDVCFRTSDQIGELQLVELANILDGIDTGVPVSPWAT